MRKTKIVCTLGPATNSAKKVVELIKSGMNIVRLNFSHGTHEDHKELIHIIRKVASELKSPLAILQDLQGPKLRVGKMENGSIELKEGNAIKIITSEVLGNERIISTTYKNLAKDLKPGDNILLDDGLIKLQVSETGEKSVTCKIIEGGILSDHKGMNLPGVAISQPSLTEKDHKDLLFGINNDVDFIAISFVRSPEDVIQVKKIIADHKKEIMVISKLEKPEAIQHLDKIMEITDGVMIARGDLGVEVPLEKVPSLQKQIILAAIRLGKPVITATQMLESMRQFSRPTRAEVSDVANAIYDGTDAVMLSAETATGKFPVETVQTMDKIIREAESNTACRTPYHLNEDEKTQSIADAISNSACEAAEQLNIKAVVAFTKTGFTARMVAKYRPQTNIISFTPLEIIQRQLNLSWGITPIKMDYLESTDEIIQHTENILKQKGFVKPGDVVAVLLGAPVFERGTTNLLKLHVVA